MIENEKFKEIDEKVKREVALKEESSLPTPSNLAFKYDESKTIDQNANDLVELKASKVASEDEQFIEQIAETKKKAIEKSAAANKEIHIAKKEAEKINALTQIDVAFYEQWKYVLNWGGIKEPTKRIFSIFMLLLILPFFTIVTLVITLPISIVKTLLMTINNLIEEVKTFGKLARSIALSLFIIGIMALIAYIIYFYLNKYGIIKF